MGFCFPAVWIPLVCAIAARESSAPIETFAIGMSEDAIDLKYARQVAEYIGSHHTEVYMTPGEVISSLEDVIHLLGTYDITTIRASMGMYLVCKAIHEQTDLRVILTGEISDELFGYKYTDFAPSAETFQEEAEKRIRELHMYDVLRADRCISVNSLEARVPFGDLDFVRYVMSLDPEMKLNKYGKGKYLLRHAFEGREFLPDSILWRKKQPSLTRWVIPWWTISKNMRRVSIRMRNMKKSGIGTPTRGPLPRNRSCIGNCLKSIIPARRK